MSDLHNMIIQALDKKQQLSKIKAKVRALVFEVIDA